MRKILGNIQNYTNTFNNVEVTFLFCDKYGYETTYFENNKLLENITVSTDANGDFEVELYETLKHKKRFHYRIKIENKILPIKLFIPEGDTSLNILKVDKFEKNLELFYEYIEKDESYKFMVGIEDIFIKYFFGENDFFNKDENNLINAFINYADGKNDRKDMKALDEYLGSL